MPDPLVVHLNRGELYDVEPTVDVYGSSGPFLVELRNHGQAMHVHLRLDDALSPVAEPEAPNHFVDTESTTRVHVEVDEGRTADGALAVVTGYGKGRGSVDVRLGPDVDESEPVAVREDLGRPTGGDDGAGPLAGVSLGGATPVVVALGALALALAATAGLVANELTVVLGIMAVLVGVAVAGYLLVS